MTISELQIDHMHSIRITVVDLLCKKFVNLYFNIAFIKGGPYKEKTIAGFKNRKIIVEI